MKILIVIPQLPYPIFKNGICSTIGNIIPFWTKENNVTFLYFDEKDIDAENIIKSKYGIECNHHNILGKEYVYEFKGKCYVKPRNSWNYCFNKYTDIDISNYDIVILGSFVSSFLISSFTTNDNNQKIFFFEADAMSLFYKRSIEKANNIFKKMYFLSQMKIVRKMEKLFYNYSNKVIFVSDVDMKYTISLSDMSIINKFVSAHIGVAVNKERTSDFINVKKHVNLCFSGLMDYQPNKKAVEYILNDIIPQLDYENIPFTFHIIGNNPQPNWSENKYVKLGKVIITGYVKDIDEYLSSMDLYISPLFLGTGMKNKILQAMAIGLPIVCSKVSIEGINELIDNYNVLICSEELSDWIEKIKSLSGNINKMESFSNINKEIIKKEYSWQQTAINLLSGGKNE